MKVVFPFKDETKCRVTCEYGRKGDWSSGKHDGVDLVSDGDKTILSCTDGTVIRSGINNSWGEYVVIQLPDGRALVYAHMVKGSRKVSVNQKVKAGQPIGIMGSTGRSSGAHLHLELQKSYYKCGLVDDVAKLLSIENKVGKVKSTAKEEYKVGKIKVEQNGKQVEVEAIKQNGTNFVKVRDLEKLAPVTVGYNGKTGNVIVERV